MTHRIIVPPFTPYRPGDLIEVTDPAGDGTSTTKIRVERCIALAAHDRWRVTARRPDGKLHDVTVDGEGYALHGYATRPDGAR